MTLLKSISGIRGTIGGKAEETLSPIDVVSFVSAFCTFLITKQKSRNKKIVVGRDARVSGDMIAQLSIQSAIAMGFEVVYLGLTTTPTVAIAVGLEKAIGGIIITASHNPIEWNALKFLNDKGEFMSEADGKNILEIIQAKTSVFVPIDHLGSVVQKDYLQTHIDLVLNYPLVHQQAIQKAKLRIVVDGINSTGAVYIKALLEALGVSHIEVIHSEMNGRFAHDPEPLAKNLTDLCKRVVSQKADLGIAIDPDVDRLCFVSEDGVLFGEEYTIVVVADYFLSHVATPTVSNLSSTQALKDITLQKGQAYYASKVGEVNVVERMKNTGSLIGGEGNGGVIVGDFHYGRDALIGTALFLSKLALSGEKLSTLKKAYPLYFMYKTKIDVPKKWSIAQIFAHVKALYQDASMVEEDGLKLIWEKEREWIHIRSSNTEPLIRIYTESPVEERSKHLANTLIASVEKAFLKE